MYERFTDIARKTMQLANMEAQRFNHEYIGTEHLLLGLIKEGSGVAASVLKNLNMDLRKIRHEVEKIVHSGPDTVTMGRLPQTPNAKKVIEYAIKKAVELQHNYVGTEHILLGLLRVEEAVAAQVLMQLGLTLEGTRAAIRKLLEPTDGVSEEAKSLNNPLIMKGATTYIAILRVCSTREKPIMDKKGEQQIGVEWESSVELAMPHAMTFTSREGTDDATSERQRCIVHLEGMAERAESPAIKAAYKVAAKQLREMS